MTMPTMAQPRHFAGEITALTLGCCLGLHRMEVQLTDDDGGQHTVYVGYGRGADAERYARQQYERLSVGQWVHGSATLMRRTPGLTEWAGHVPPLQPCQRRHRFSTASRAAA